MAKNNKNSQRTRSRANKKGQYNSKGPKNPLWSTGKDAVKDPMSAVVLSSGLKIDNLPLFAQRTRRLLTYYSSGTIITGTATANAYVFSANGCFDPDITGTGGQPMGFDQMMLFYNHYTVLRSRIRVVATNTSASLMSNAGVFKSGASTQTSSIEQVVENGDLAWCPLGFFGAAGSTALLTQSCDCAKFQGIDNILDDPDMRGDAASNPTEQMYFHLSTWNAASATQITLQFQAVIEYDVVFHEPRKGPLS